MEVRELRPVVLKSRFENDADDGSVLRLVPLRAIKPRPNQPTRGINREHAADLAESIKAIGLLQPIVVDRFVCLVAGDHRREAISLLVEMGDIDGERIPVRVLQSLDAASDPQAALLAELAENEKRRDYTRSEILGIAERLRVAGFRDAGGRPRRGERPLMPALSTAVGKSRRRLQQILHGTPKETAQDCAVLLGRLQRLIEKLRDELPRGRHARRLRQALKDLEPLVGRAAREASTGRRGPTASGRGLGR